MKIFRLVLAGVISIVLLSCGGFLFAQDNEQAEEEIVKDPIVKMHTNYGDITIKLYNDTPQHRDNFLKLVEECFYDSTLFHRVIAGFMIQAGDPDSKGAMPQKQLGAGGPGYTVSAEFRKDLIHKKGRARSSTPGRPG